MVSTRLVSSLSLEYARPMLSRASQKKGPARSCSPALPGTGGGEGDRTGVAEGGGGVAGGRGGRAAIFAPARSPRRSQHEYRCFPHLQPAGEDDLQRQGLQVRPAAARGFFPGTSACSGSPLPPPRQTPAGTSWACLGLLPCFNSPAPNLFPPLLCWALRSPHTRRPPGPLMKSPIGLFLVSQCRPSLTRIQTGPFPASPLS